MAKHSRWTIIRSLTSVAVFACTQAHAMDEQSDLAFTKNPAVTSDRVVVGNTTLYELNKVNGHVLSKYALHSPLVSAPISVNGTTYVATNNGQLRAIRNGVQIWKLVLPDGEKFPGFDCKLILVGDYLLVAGDQQTVCVSKSNGRKQWQVPFSGVIIVSGNKVIIEHRHGIETIDLVSGKSLWKLSTGFDDMNGPILVRDGAVYVSDGQMDGQFYKLDENSGKILWQSSAYIQSGSIVPLAETQVAAVERDGAIDIFDAASGKLEKYQATGKPHQIRELAFNHGVLYCAGTGLEGAFVRAYNPQTKEGLWVTYFEEKDDLLASGGPDSYPVFYGNSLLFEITNAMVYSFDATTGEILWKTDTADRPNTEPDVYLVGSNACVISYHSLTGLDASSGKIRWKVSLGDEVVTGTPVQQGHLLYFQTSLATAYAVDLNSGAIVWSFSANEKKKTEGKAVKIQTPKPFSPAAWLAVTRQAKWSRRNLLDDFVANYGGELRHLQLKRKKSLALLGPPTLSYRYPKCKSRDKEGTVDDYRLSNKSGVFELVYDGDSLSRCEQSDEALTLKSRFGIMPSGSGGLSMSKVQSACGCDTYADLIKVLGPPQRSEENLSPSFPTPIRRSQYMWKILGDGRRILWVLTEGNFDTELSKRPICVFAILTLGDDLK
jgi:outer membrane protein assembly factor BamB